MGIGTKAGDTATAAVTRAAQQAPGDPPAFLAVCLVLVYIDDRTLVARLDDGASLTIGRSREADITVPSTGVSRVHARFRREGSTVRVSDLESRNGTSVNGEPIGADALVPPGATISVGPATVLVSGPREVAKTTSPGTVSLDELNRHLDSECHRSALTRRPVALIALRIDAPDDVLPRAEHAVRRRLRPFDVCAAYRPRELCVLRPEEGVSEARVAAEGILSAVAGIPGARCVAGIAVHAVDGVGAAVLLSAARDAMRSAAAGGRSIVASDLAEPTTEESVPVFVDPRGRQALELARRVAASPLNVLLLGETGAGKEVVAREVHRASGRTGPFLAVNCAALPEQLLESTLFGHERGAFTGADARRKGYFEVAGGGTLLLDEIGDLGPDLQAKLLRAIERKTIVRVGATNEIPVDVRIVAATHRDLEARVQAGQFREDLWYRLAAFVLEVPPLRERPLDVPELASRFAADMAAQMDLPTPTLSEEALAQLGTYGWPGNVRELKNVMERAVVLSGGQPIERHHFPEAVLAVVSGVGRAGDTVAQDGLDRIARLEREAIAEALAQCGGNQTRAAALLGISRRALIYRMEKYGLKPGPGESQKSGAGE